jgi:glyoxylase-like metal-dependent hydrolase (beta-lactamase superfamily II)
VTDVSEPVRITVSDGSPEGSNSAYFLPAHGTLVDPGPPGDAAFGRLRRGIESAGYGLRDIDHGVVTHWHVDHVGLAPRVAEEADATIHMHERDAPLLAEYATGRRRRVRRDRETLIDWGVPEPRIDDVRETDTPSPLPETTAVESLADGDTVAGGEVIHTPGHTEGHLAIRFGQSMFVGDTVLPTYTPNVGGSDTRAEAPLTDYLASLDRIALHTGAFYPGHGSRISVPERFETILSHHRERARRVFDRLDATGEATPWDIAVELFGEMRGIHIKFGAGEASAHLRALSAQQFVECVDTNPRTYVVVEHPAADANLLTAGE